MAKTTQDKLERNDIYTAFAVLAFFGLFGYFIYSLNGDSELPEMVWVDKPPIPDGYQGYPYPHDDESIERIEPIEELAPLTKRAIKPATNFVAQSELVNPAKPMASVAPIIREKTTERYEKNAPTKEIRDIASEKIEEPVVANDAPAIVKPAPNVKPLPKPTPAEEPEEKKTVKEVAAPVKTLSKPSPVKSTVVTGAEGMNYITSNLPCVWVVGIFKNPNNVNRVVARLRLNKFDVATGAHEKGNYVGVPCNCEENDSKQAQLRDIFSAQPWMLKK